MGGLGKLSVPTGQHGRAGEPAQDLFLPAWQRQPSDHSGPDQGSIESVVSSGDVLFPGSDWHIDLHHRAECPRADKEQPE